jgi:hypothetical protein
MESCDDDLIFYLVSFSLSRENRDIVDINVRVSGQPEETARTNSITLEQFRRISQTILNAPAEQVEGEVQRMQRGRNVVLNLHSSEAGLQRTGPLG